MFSPLRAITPLTLLLSAGTATADLRWWTNPVAGAFNTPTAWTPNGVPGAADDAGFGLNPSQAPFNVTMGPATTLRTLDVFSQRPTLLLNGRSLSVTELLRVGVGGGVGTLVLDGGVTQAGNIAVGGDTGEGSLRVRNGAQVTASAFGAGYGNPPAFGTIDISGPGTTFTKATCCDSTFGGGAGNVGALSISGGALFSYSDGFFAFGREGGSGGLLIDGPGSALTFANGNLAIGAGAQGNVPGSGTATVRNSGEITSSFGMYVSSGRSTGSLTVESGGRVATEFLAVAHGAGASGTVTARGGGQVQLNGNLSVGFDDQASGSVVIESGAAVVAPGMEIGHGGAGSLSVRSGGSLTVNGVAAGYRDTGSATITVEGVGSRITGIGTLGSSRPATLTASGGALIQSGPNPPQFSWNDYIGIDSQSEVTLTGAGTRWENINGLWVGGIYFDTGGAGRGTLRVLDGASISGRGPIYVGGGAAANDTGVMIVGGATSEARAQFGLVVGHAGQAPEASELVLRGGTIGGAVQTRAGGILKGTGTIAPFQLPFNGTLLQGAGIWAPGESGVGAVGRLTINGRGVASEGTTVRADIRGSGPGTFDTMAFSGTFVAAGTLRLDLTGFTPQNGDSWDLITCSALTGQFGQVFGAGDVGGGRYIIVEYTPTTVRARCVQISSLSVVPGTASVLAGFLTPIRAVATTPSGPVDISGIAGWASSNGTIATVDAQGRVRGQSVGTCEISATIGALAASTLVTVEPLPEPLTIERVSLTSLGGQIGGSSTLPSISGDGRYVAFYTSAGGVVPGTPANVAQAFLRDVEGGATTLLSRGPANAPANDFTYEPRVSRNGRFVAFTSYASNLVPADTNSRADVFLLDRTTGLIERVSVPAAAAEGSDDSILGTASDDGDRVFFVSFASNMVPGDTNAAPDVFVRHRQSGQTTRLSQSADGATSGASSASLATTDDGRFVVFESAAALVPEDTNGINDVYLRDLQAGTIERVSVGSGGEQGNGSSQGFGRIISNDGRFVVFQSVATNLFPGDTNNARDVLIRDRMMGTTALVNTRPDGTAASGGVGSVCISADGRIVAWRALGGDTVPLDTNGQNDVFVKDMRTGEIRRISLSPLDEQGDGGSSFIDISSDGQFIVFESTATNFAPFDTNAATDIFRVRVNVPICPADVNNDGLVDPDDLSDYIGCFFASPPCVAVGDVNGDGAIDPDDLSDYIGLFFGPACE